MNLPPPQVYLTLPWDDYLQYHLFIVTTQIPHQLTTKSLTSAWSLPAVESPRTETGSPESSPNTWSGRRLPTMPPRVLRSRRQKVRKSVTWQPPPLRPLATLESTTARTATSSFTTSPCTTFTRVCTRLWTTIPSDVPRVRSTARTGSSLCSTLSGMSSIHTPSLTMNLLGRSTRPKLVPKQIMKSA